MKTVLERSSARPGITAQTRAIQVRRILVTTDFSRASLHAISCALAVSRHFKAEVHLVHVVDTTQHASKSVRLSLISPAELSRPLIKRLQAVAVKYGAAGKIHVMKLREGRAYKEICAAARQLRADLIVIATHGYTGFKHVFLGSTAERVVQHSPCPVLIVGRDGSRFEQGKIRLRKILVPIDFSSCSQVAFDCAVALDREFHAELRLVHVIDPYSYPFGEEYAAPHRANLMTQARAGARRKMNAIVARSGARCATQVREGSPAPAICKAARRDVDLIVTPTHGRTGLAHIFIGSVAERVVRHASCPVLVIPTRSQLTSVRKPK